MIALALDLSSTSSGYSIFENNEYIESGVVASLSGDLIKRIYAMKEKVKELLEKYKIDKIIIEEVRSDYKNVHTYKVLTYVQAAIAFTVYDYDPKLEISFIQPNSWRAKIGIKTGRGVKRAELKAKDIQYVKDRFNLEVNDDEADAICINCAFWIERGLNW